jgi:hypothetical protein
MWKKATIKFDEGFGDIIPIIKLEKNYKKNNLKSFKVFIRYGKEEGETKEIEMRWNDEKEKELLNIIFNQLKRKEFIYLKRFFKICLLSLASVGSISVGYRELFFDEVDPCGIKISFDENNILSFDTNHINDLLLKGFLDFSDPILICCLLILTNCIPIERLPKSNEENFIEIIKKEGKWEILENNPMKEFGNFWIKCLFEEDLSNINIDYFVKVID